MSLPMKCLVDTNVPKTANLATQPDPQSDVPDSCVVACIEAIRHVINKRSLIIDAGDEIFDEYRRQLSMRGQPGVGDRFMKWVHDNRFGEWCYAQHLIYYERLPDWFLGYDIYDKLSGHFLSSYRRNQICEKIRITRVPVIARGRFLLPDLVKLLTRSQLTDHPAEGLYLRYDQNKWLVQRAKLVRPEFIRAIGKHWSRTPIRPNRLHLENGNEIIPSLC